MLDLIIETCVHRRLAALFVAGVIAAFGVRAYLLTPVEAFPDVTNVQVQIIGNAGGMSPPEVEKLVRERSPFNQVK